MFRSNRSHQYGTLRQMIGKEKKEGKQWVYLRAISTLASKDGREFHHMVGDCLAVRNTTLRYIKAQFLKW